MKYKDINKETARKICKRFKKTCENCPLRRENKAGHILYCTYFLLQFYEPNEFQTEKGRENDEIAKQVLLEEEIQHDDEVKQVLKEMLEEQ